MTRMIWLSLLAGLIVANTATAQESTTTEGDLGLDAGVVVPYEEQFDNWFVVCSQPAGAELECSMAQPILNPLGTPAVRINIRPITDSNLFAAAANIISPLGTNLEAGVELTVDNHSPRRYGFKYCVPDGCLARIGLLRTELNSMKAGTVWKMVLYEFENTDTPIQFDLSLTGFTAAFDRLTEILAEGLNPAQAGSEDASSEN